MLKLAEKIFGKAAVTGLRYMLGYRYPNTSVTEIDRSTGRETLLSLLERSQNRLRDPNDMIRH